MRVDDKWFSWVGILIAGPFLKRDERFIFNDIFTKFLPFNFIIGVLQKKNAFWLKSSWNAKSVKSDPSTLVHRDFTKLPRGGSINLVYYKVSYYVLWVISN